MAVGYNCGSEHRQEGHSLIGVNGLGGRDIAVPARRLF